VITEIERTEKAVEALERRDYITFGHLMNESHDSLRCKEHSLLTQAQYEGGDGGHVGKGAGALSCSRGCGGVLSPESLVGGEKMFPGWGMEVCLVGGVFSPKPYPWFTLVQGRL